MTEGGTANRPHTNNMDNLKLAKRRVLQGRRALDQAKANMAEAQSNFQLSLFGLTFSILAVIAIAFSK